MTSPILVTGHEGYVGSGLFLYLLKRKHRVLGWGRRDNIFSLNAAFLRKEKIKILVNLATVTDRGPEPYRIGSPADHVNAGGARHLAKILKGSDILWIQISTKDVYGNVFGPSSVVETKKAYRPKFLVDDDQPFSPGTPYAKSKLMAEIISESHAYSNVIRLSTCYTDFSHHRGNWMVQMIKAALAGQKVPTTHNGKQFRDPLHVDDLGRLIELLAQKGVYGQKFNAGGGKYNIISLLEFLDLAAPGAKIEKCPGGDYGFAFNNRKVFQLTGWKPRLLFRNRIPLMVKNIQSRNTVF